MLEKKKEKGEKNEGHYLSEKDSVLTDRKVREKSVAELSVAENHSKWKIETFRLFKQL